MLIWSEHTFKTKKQAKKQRNLTLNEALITDIYTNIAFLVSCIL